MKHIIIEGGDRLGKSTIIDSLNKHFNYDNVTIRHFGKPPKTFPSGFSPLEFQAECFDKEAELMVYLRQFENDVFNYFENVLIWNRAHLGEYVYGQMFRGQDPLGIKKYLESYESKYLIDHPDETYLFLLTANDPEFFLSKEDGNSFSQSLEEKERELRLFDEAFENSLIDKKFKIIVNNGKEFLPKDMIFSYVTQFLKT